MSWRSHAFLAAVPLVVLLQARIEPTLGSTDQEYGDVLEVWSGEGLRRLSPGLEDVMADVYWLRTIQYFGAQSVSRRSRFELLGPLTRITTTLDPEFEMAYRYGAIFLSEPPPMGAGRPQEGVALLERGVRNLPRSWRVRQDLGFFRFFFLRDARGGAEILLEAAKLPDAPLFLTSLAADILGKGGERETARKIWRHMYEQGEGGLKVNAFLQLRYLDALDQIDALNGLLARYEERTGRRASSLQDLVAAGLLRGIPLDPGGVPFSYDAEKGGVSVSIQSPFWRPAS